MLHQGHGDRIVLADTNFPSASICGEGADGPRQVKTSIPEKPTFFCPRCALTVIRSQFCLRQFSSCCLSIHMFMRRYDSSLTEISYNMEFTNWVPIYVLEGPKFFVTQSGDAHGSCEQGQELWHACSSCLGNLSDST